MSDDNFSNGASKARAVLGDITNLESKRELLVISDDLGLKSGVAYSKNALISQDGDSSFAKKVRLGVENMAKEKCKTKVGVDNTNEKGLFPLKDRQACYSSPTKCKSDNSQKNMISVISHKPNEIKETYNLVDVGANFSKSSIVFQTSGEVGDASRDSCASSDSTPTMSDPCMKDSDDDRRIPSNIAQSDMVDQALVTDVYSSDEKDLNVGKLASSKYGSVEWSRLPKSQGSKSFELDRCRALKGDIGANLNAHTDLLKTCSCSFCLKAAYIWSDLYYQDMKGRLTALKKSQKEASILANKFAMGKQTDMHTQGNSNKSSTLESELADQWSSLFRHMEDIFVHESSRLQDSFLTMNDLRENCKTDLERTTGMPPDQD